MWPLLTNTFAHICSWFKQRSFSYTYEHTHACQPTHQETKGVEDDQNVLWLWLDFGHSDDSYDGDDHGVWIGSLTGQRTRRILWTTKCEMTPKPGRLRAGGVTTRYPSTVGPRNTSSWGLPRPRQRVSGPLPSPGSSTRKSETRAIAALVLFATIHYTYIYMYI